ncbi:pyridoxal kinase [Trichodelitschia bisporula]|uniref:pyridoxal kinase n=1 Tax=Trichodelitschia bisporula TaxID=703511 RepID=A0A6G1I6H1_9PEZI|nr:pyridoxal kinase [Trichodelitschia bisporula]
MSRDPTVPETRVLAIASHVVFGYVGNKMASFVLQSLGCEVSAINTVNYSNHTAYRQFRGTQVPASEILDLYEGLRQSFLNDFDVLLSGYIPSKEAVDAVGKIGRDLKFASTTKPGAFFWALDPVMGDEGRLYISPDVVPAYKSLLPHADLALPNQFEAELLSDVKITDRASLLKALQALHKTYNLPHVIITSLRFPSGSDLGCKDGVEDMITVVGSTATAGHEPRAFRVDTHAFPAFFSGTGDMFAALTVARLREAVRDAGLASTLSWRSADDVKATDLPLARAVEKVVASMQAVLGKTWKAREEVRVEVEGQMDRAGLVRGSEGREEEEKIRHLRLTRAAEVRLVRNVGDLVSPPEGERFRARAVEGDETEAEQGKGEEGETEEKPAGEKTVEGEGIETEAVVVVEPEEVSHTTSKDTTEAERKPAP